MHATAKRHFRRMGRRGSASLNTFALTPDVAGHFCHKLPSLLRLELKILILLTH